MLKAIVNDAATGILANFSGDSVVSRFQFYTVYISLSLSLNVLLTLMIVTRLVLHGRNIHAATGSSAGISGLYKSIATMLIESSALFAVSSVLAIGLWAANSAVSNVFVRIIAETQVSAFPRLRCYLMSRGQVIASLLIIQRVADKSALTSDTFAPRSTSPFKTSGQEGLVGSGRMS